MVGYCGEEVAEAAQISGGWVHILLVTAQEKSYLIPAVADSVQVVQGKEVGR